MHAVNQLQKDALCELFNISVNQAAYTLSEITRQKVDMNVPEVEICERVRLEQYFRNTQSLSCVRQHFNSEFEGDALLIFPEEQINRLILLAVGTETPVENLSAIEEDALGEIGNVVLNSCLASMFDLFSQHFDVDIPEVLLKLSVDELYKGYKDNQLILIKITFLIEGEELEGHIALVLNSPSLERLIESVNVFIAL